jgi:hypothetical protein
MAQDMKIWFESFKKCVERFERFQKISSVSFFHGPAASKILFAFLFVFSFFSFFVWKSPPFLLYPPTHVSTHNNTHVSRNTHT